MSISTHVLDTSIGRPAAAVSVRLQRQADAAWTDVATAVTDGDGRAAALVPAGVLLAAGAYRLTFDVAAYFRARRVESFYATVAIEFLVRDPAAHYHVPLLLSPHGYTTYRGS